MATIDINDAYILNETGAQVDKVTGLFTKDEDTTEEEKAFAQLNIGASGGGGRNLLDNPWFSAGNVVNQRGATSGATVNAQYFIDRWMTTYDTAQGTFSVDSGGITLTPASGTNASMYQKLANADAINGKTVTASVMLSDGTIYSGTITRINGTVQNAYRDDDIQIQITSANAFKIFVFGNAKTVQAAKLELGFVSTLANDAPPNYLDELIKCQYYFERIIAETSNLGIGIGIGNGSILYVPIHIQPKWKFPTISYAGTISIGRNAVEVNVTGIRTSESYTGASLINGMFQLSVDVAHTAQTAYRLILQTGAYIDFSADL